MFNLNLSQNRLYLSRIYVFGRFFRTVSSSIEEETVTKRKKKRKYSQPMESQYFYGKKYVFKAWVLLISFIGKRVVSTSVRKLSSPSDIRRNRGLFRGSRIHILRQLFRKLSQPLSQDLLLFFSPNLAFFFFFYDAQNFLLKHLVKEFVPV